MAVIFCCVLFLWKSNWFLTPQLFNFACAPEKQKLWRCFGLGGIFFRDFCLYQKYEPRKKIKAREIFFLKRAFSFTLSSSVMRLSLGKKVFEFFFVSWKKSSEKEHPMNLKKIYRCSLQIWQDGKFNFGSDIFFEVISSNETK